MLNFSSEFGLRDVVSTPYSSRGSSQGAVARLRHLGHSFKEGLISQECRTTLDLALGLQGGGSRAEIRKLWPPAGPGVRGESQEAGGTPSARDLLPFCVPLGGKGAS